MGFQAFPQIVRIGFGCFLAPGPWVESLAIPFHPSENSTEGIENLAGSQSQ